jgi:hypothetical protein
MKAKWAAMKHTPTRMGFVRYLHVSTPPAHLPRSQRNHGTVPNVATGMTYRKAAKS